MKKRDFLSLASFEHQFPSEGAEVLSSVLVRAAQMKTSLTEADACLLRGRSVAVVLEKASTRTRVSFEAGVHQLGGHAIVLNSEGSQLARGEPIRDTARVLSGYCNLIAFRTFATARLLEMASFAQVPVINALTDESHPVQVLCDLLTVGECFGHEFSLAALRKRRVAFVGDCSSNMARSWLEASVIIGFPLTLIAPKNYLPPSEELAKGGPLLQVTTDVRAGLKGCDVINTDVWSSMGQEGEAERRKLDFSGFTLSNGLLRDVADDAIVLHCLPAHRGEEIDDDVLEGTRSRVWQQAANRMHGQKALMAYLLKRDR